MIVTNDLSKQFGDFIAVDGINLSIEPGKVLALLGQNGAGKTTTVRLLTTLLSPSRGTAKICGYDILNEPEKVRNVVGVLTEQHGLYLRMTGFDYLDFYSQIYSINQEIKTKRIAELFQLFGLEKDAKRKIGEYSKGMRQKLALARTLVHDPPVLLLDEPTSAMDPESARLVRDSIASLRSGNRTIIMCTHNLAEAESLADQVAIIYHGRILIDGPVANLKRDLLGPVEYEVTVVEEKWLDEDLIIPDGIKITGKGKSNLKFQVDDPESGNPKMIRELISNNMEVISVQEIPRTLEQVYLATMAKVMEQE